MIEILEHATARREKVIASRGVKRREIEAQRHSTLKRRVGLDFFFCLVLAEFLVTAGKKFGSAVAPRFVVCGSGVK